MKFIPNSIGRMIDSCLQMSQKVNATDGQSIDPLKEAVMPEVEAASRMNKEVKENDHRSENERNRQYVTLYWDGENIGIDEDQYYRLSESQIQDLDNYAHSILFGELDSAHIRHVKTDWGLTDVIIIPSRYIDAADYVVWI